MTFGQVLEFIKLGARAARAGWNGKGMWIKLHRPEPGGPVTMPYIFMSTATGDTVPWLASQTDILAEDWSLVAELL